MSNRCTVHMKHNKIKFKRERCEEIYTTPKLREESSFRLDQWNQVYI